MFVMDEQQLHDIPETKREEEKQKGPIPANAIFLALGLFAVLVLYYLPIWKHFFTGDPSG